MLPSEVGSNTISQPTVVEQSSTDKSTADDKINLINSGKSTLISLSRYNNLLFIERNISSIINYKMQQILEKEEAIERATRVR